MCRHHLSHSQAPTTHLGGQNGWTRTIRKRRDYQKEGEGWEMPTDWWTAKATANTLTLLTCCRGMQIIQYPVKSGPLRSPTFPNFHTILSGGLELRKYLPVETQQKNWQRCEPAKQTELNNNENKSRALACLAKSKTKASTTTTTIP